MAAQRLTAEQAVTMGEGAKCFGPGVFCRDRLPDYLYFSMVWRVQMARLCRMGLLLRLAGLGFGSEEPASCGKCWPSAMRQRYSLATRPAERGRFSPARLGWGRSASASRWMRATAGAEQSILPPWWLLSFSHGVTFWPDEAYSAGMCLGSGEVVPLVLVIVDVAVSDGVDARRIFARWMYFSWYMSIP